MLNGATSRLNGSKSLASLFVVRVNLLHPLPPLFFFWYIIISLVFFHLCEALLSGFLQLKDFVDGQNNSKYRDGAPSTESKL